MCLPTRTDDENRPASRSTTGSMFAAGGLMLAACLPGPALAGAVGGVGAGALLGVAGAAAAVGLCAAAPLLVMAVRRRGGGSR